MKSPKYFLILLIITLVSCTKKTKDVGTRNDSVEKYLQLASNDALPFDLRKKNNQKAFSFIDLDRNDTLTRWYLSKICWNFIFVNDSSNYCKVSKLHFKKSKESNDTLNLARFYRYRGNFYRIIAKKNDSSFFYYVKSEKFYKKINEQEGLARIYLNKSILQNDLADYTGAEYSISKVYTYYKKTKDYNNLYTCYNLLGNVNHSIRNYSEAIKYHKKALNLLKNNKMKKEYGFSYTGTTLNNIGNSYRELKKYDSAVFFFQKALNDKKEMKKDAEIKGFLYNNLGYCYLNQNKFQQLPYLFEKAAQVFDSIDIKDEAAISRIYLSNFYTRKKDTIKAIHYAEKALKLAKESKNNYYHLYALSNAGGINKLKAPFYIKEYHRLNDSLLFEERKARNQFFKIQLETDEIAQEKEKAIKQKWVQTSIIATVLLIVILLFIIFKQRAQKKEFVLIQNQQKANEEIYQLMLNQQVKEEEAKQKEKKRIALELHDNVMNKLASTRFNLFALTQQQDDTTLQSATQSITKIKEVEDEIRNLTHVLAKETFARNDSFASLLDELIRQQNQLQATPFTLTIDPKINWDDIGSEVKMNYYRIIQEALHNTNKHAQASQGEINIQLEHNQLQLTLTDNGVGFDAKANPQGIGLQNMQQRMELIGGTLSIRTAPGKGTVINCLVAV